MDGHSVNKLQLKRYAGAPARSPGFHDDILASLKCYF